MKGVSDLKGLRDSRSMRTAKSSIPIRVDSAYLDLFMLQKEKERLEKEQFRLDKSEEVLLKRKEGVQKRLNEIGEEMEALQEIAKKEEGQAASRRDIRNSTVEKKWKAMPLSY